MFLHWTNIFLQIVGMKKKLEVFIHTNWRKKMYTVWIIYSNHKKRWIIQQKHSRLWTSLHFFQVMEIFYWITLTVLKILTLNIIFEKSLWYFVSFFQVSCTHDLAILGFSADCTNNTIYNISRELLVCINIHPLIIKIGQGLFFCIGVNGIHQGVLPHVKRGDEK